MTIEMTAGRGGGAMMAPSDGAGVMIIAGAVLDASTGQLDAPLDAAAGELDAPDVLDATLDAAAEGSVGLGAPLDAAAGELDATLDAAVEGSVELGAPLDAAADLDTFSA